MLLTWSKQTEKMTILFFQLLLIPVFCTSLTAGANLPRSLPEDEQNLDILSLLLLEDAQDNLPNLPNFSMPVQNEIYPLLVNDPVNESMGSMNDSRSIFDVNFGFVNQINEMEVEVDSELWNIFNEVMTKDPLVETFPIDELEDDQWPEFVLEISADPPVNISMRNDGSIIDENGEVQIISYDNLFMIWLIAVMVSALIALGVTFCIKEFCFNRLKATKQMDYKHMHNQFV